ncbi:MAG: dihydroorotase, partial [Gammaproteobacteria bacterium]
MSRLHIRNARIINPANSSVENGDVYIADGHIAALQHAPDGFAADQVLDASGLSLMPGIVDLCARLREPGDEHKATIASECKAASANGITTMCCPPDTDPVVDEPAVVELIRRISSNTGLSKVMVLGALTYRLKGERLSEMWALKNAGCIGVSNARAPVVNTQVLRRAYFYAANCNQTVYIEPDDHWLSMQGCAHEGPVATRLGLQGIPVSAETTALARSLELIAETGVRAHFGRLSCAHSVELIRRAKQSGIRVTADVSAHQLHLTEQDISSFNSAFHVLPPLRSQRDMEALRQGVADGTIDIICSDHQPHEPDAKQQPFPSSSPGISALDTLLPLVLALVDDGELEMQTAIRALTTHPADVLEIPAGRIEARAVADLCLFETDADWQLSTEQMHSR